MILRKRISGAAAAVCFLLMIGSIGAADCGTSQFVPAIIRAAVFLVLTAVFAKLAGGFEA